MVTPPVATGSVEDWVMIALKTVASVLTRMSQDPHDDS
jgi:hypothetical protein